MQHALFLTFLQEVSAGHLGESRRIDDYCQDWGLSADSVSGLWTWLNTDPRAFDHERLPVALDTVNRTAYRKARGQRELAWSASAGLWGMAVVYVTVAALFAILDLARLTTWPAAWGWKLLVLVIFVSLGGLAHVAAKALNINYDDPMKVYDAGNLLEWLSLRWIAVLWLYVPIVFVVATLWGAHNVPASFSTLGTAILAGYSADSIFGAATSRLKPQKTLNSSQSQAPTP